MLLYTVKLIGREEVAETTMAFYFEKPEKDILTISPLLFILSAVLPLWLLLCEKCSVMPG